MIPKIGIVGDSMIDQYYSVQIKKISPEFPIPVMHSLNEECKICPGGAANVAYQFLHFNVDARLISFLDKEADLEFQKSKINTENCLLIDNKIPRKKRFYSDNVPTYRWDVENSLYGLEESISDKCFELYSKNKEKVKDLDAIIFSDYDKGLFSNYDGNLSKFIKDTNISVVDPKSKNIDKWFGCTVFKPNYLEATTFSGKSDITEAGFWIKSRIKCKYVIITNAEKSIFIIGGDNKDNYWSKEIKPKTNIGFAQSVIGAGDCFTAMLTYKLVKNFSIEESVEFACKASSNYVKNKFNSPVCEPCLLEEKYIEDPKILNKRSFKLVLTNGYFDSLQGDHIDLLKFAKSKGDRLVVALNSESNLQIKDRIKILSSLEFVDFIVSCSESNLSDLIKKIKPDVLIKGLKCGKNQIIGSNNVTETLFFPAIKDLITKED